MVVHCIQYVEIKAKESKKCRIIPRHIMLAIKNDEELKSLLPLAILPQGGAMPNIRPQLLPKAYRKFKHIAKEADTTS